MNKNRIDTLYEIYEEKLFEDGFSDNFLQPFVEMLIKGLSYILIFDDEQELKKDLMENKQLRKIIGRYYFKLGNHQEKIYLLKIIFDISKHIKNYRFNNKEEQE